MPDSGKFKDLYLNSAVTYPCPPPPDFRRQPVTGPLSFASISPRLRRVAARPEHTPLSDGAPSAPGEWASPLPTDCARPPSLIPTVAALDAPLGSRSRGRHISYIDAGSRQPPRWTEARRRLCATHTKRINDDSHRRTPTPDPVRRPGRAGLVRHRAGPVLHRHAAGGSAGRLRFPPSLRESSSRQRTTPLRSPGTIPPTATITHYQIFRRDRAVHDPSASS